MYKNQLIIESGNRKISEFMAKSISSNGVKFIIVIHTPEGIKITELDHFIEYNCKYHSSFDWLMPACRKFDMLSIEDTTGEYEALSDELDKCAAFYEILPLWQQLVKCITWYNKQPK